MRRVALVDDIRALLAHAIGPDTVLTDFVLAAAWADKDGDMRWIAVADSNAPITSTLGLLDLAKLDLVAKCDTGLPFGYGDEA